jgi:hypothetical protein
MLEGATGMRYDGVVYREVCDEDGPTRLNFMAYWREANEGEWLTARMFSAKMGYSTS